MNFDSSFPREQFVRKRRNPALLIACAVAVLAGGGAWWWSGSIGQRQTARFAVSADQVYLFANVHGPVVASVLRKSPPTPWTRYQNGSASRLAILLTDESSAWLGLVHGLKTIGVPLLVTDDYHVAVRHRFLLVYPAMNGPRMSATARYALRRFVRDGGTLVSFDRLPGSEQKVLFGIDAEAPSRLRFNIRLDGSQAVASAFLDPAERTIRFANPADRALNMGSYGYRPAHDKALATFNDGSAAITQHRYGRGMAYAIGFDVGFLLLKGYNNREQGIAKRYVNGFEPTLDVLLRLMRTMYHTAEPVAVTLGTVPNDRRFAVVIAHDIDSAVAVGHSLGYARYERSAGIAATYFIQTKYIRDYNDVTFFDAAAVSVVRGLQARGMEIGSHSVSHSRQFATFPLGTGAEQYPAYLPFIQNQTLTYNGSIFGELRVSRFLLEHFNAGVRVVSFRPGNLANPYILPNALAATGYKFSSAVTADDSLTHLPFQLNNDRGIPSESSLYEFPITVEDEEAPRMDRREAAAERLARKIGRYGGLFSILIHPNVLSYKLDFERRFVRTFKSTAWFGSMRQYGDWWAARDAVRVDVFPRSGGTTIRLSVPVRIDGLTVVLPRNARVLSARPANSVKRAGAGRVVLNAVQGTVELRLSAP